MEIKRQELTPETKVRVYNEYGGTVDYKTERGERRFMAGTYKDIELAELSNLINGNNGRAVFDRGILVIKDARAREYLDLSPLGDYNLDADGIQALLKTYNLKDIEQFLQYCSDDVLEKMIRVAIDMPMKDLNIANLIKGYSGVNVIESIQEKIEEETATTGIRQRVDGSAPVEPTAPRGRKVPTN